VNASETTVDTLVTEHLPKLLRTAGDISAEWALWQDMPHAELPVERFAASDG
jgi:IclR family pca regulon transcriptional regulator